MTAKEKKIKAQGLIMYHLSGIGYGTAWEDLTKEIGSQEETEKIVKQQMDRIAKIMGYKEAWYS